MKCLARLLATFTLITTLAHAEAQLDQSTIDAGKVHEVCMTLTEGQNLVYFFKSSKTMNFNIHYHEGETVNFPVEEYPTDMASDVFTATVEHGYCMMWTNQNENAVELEVRYEVQQDFSKTQLGGLTSSRAIPILYE